MAKKRKASRSKSRGKSQSASLVKRLVQLAALVLLGAIIYSAWFWWDMRTWRPDEGTWPEQGAVIASGSPGVRFETLKATGAQFVYLELAPSGAAPDPGFRERMSYALEAGLKVGVILPFDPCVRADPQSARFTRMVARNADLLPPALAMIATPQNCARPINKASVTSEVTTLVNQIEAHAGQPVILKLGEEFEDTYGLSGKIDRDLWLIRDRAQPRYAPRPWLLWSANSQLVSEAAPRPVEWVVVQR